MELYIRIVDGQPFEHPILGDNFRQVFPEIDTNNLPPEFARFVRVAPPSIGVYEVLNVAYELVDGVYTDVYQVVPMTEQQKFDLQNAVKADWVANGPYPSWVFNEDTCGFYAPVAMPIDSKRYRWDESTISWVEVPATQP
jgi:hypothetical protein